MIQLRNPSSQTVLASASSLSINFVNPAAPATTDDLLFQNTSGQAAVWDVTGNARTGGGTVSLNPGPAWRAVGTGAFFTGDTADILWQNMGTGQASFWEMDGNILIGGGTVSPILARL